MQSDTPRRIVDALTTYHHLPTREPDVPTADRRCTNRRSFGIDGCSGRRYLLWLEEIEAQENGWRTGQSLATGRLSAFRELQSALTLWSRPSGFTGVTVRRASSMSWQQTIANARAVSSLLHKSPRLRAWRRASCPRARPATHAQAGRLAEAVDQLLGRAAALALRVAPRKTPAAASALADLLARRKGLTRLTETLARWAIKP